MIGLIAAGIGAIGLLVAMRRADANRETGAYASAPIVSRTRSTGRRRKTPDVDCCDAPDDNWRSSRATYDRWRAPYDMSYREALGLCWDESVAATERGDYSKPASRRCALGKRHQNKLTQWKQCRQSCKARNDADPFADPFAEAAADAAIERWPDGDITGATIWGSPNSQELVRITPLGRDEGWRIETRKGRGAWRFVDQVTDETDADHKAIEILTSPF